MERAGRVRFRYDRDRAVPEQGTYVAPHIFELESAGDLQEEVFGPVLHVVRYEATNSMPCSTPSRRNGSGLTLGVHSRIDATVARILAAPSPAMSMSTAT